MTTRQTALGLATLGAGLATLFFLDSTTSTLVGVVLLTLGTGASVLAGVLGIRVPDQRRADDAERQRDAAASAALQRASETGRWPRVIGGG